MCFAEREPRGRRLGGRPAFAPYVLHLDENYSGQPHIDKIVKLRGKQKAEAIVVTMLMRCPGYSIFVVVMLNTISVCIAFVSLLCIANDVPYSILCIWSGHDG